LWGTTAASVGVNEKFLKSKGFPYKAIYLHPNQHAEFYPNVCKVHMKLLFDPASGKIYGAQAVGEDGVEKRIDVIATAMMGGMTARDLQDVELCYAPSFGAARDPVNFAGMIAANIMDGLLDTLTPLELIDSVKSGAFASSKTTLLDVREAASVAAKPICTVPAAQTLNIQLELLRRTLETDPVVKERLSQGPIVVSCMSGQRAHVASCMLRNMGFKDVRVLTGSALTFGVTCQAMGRACHQMCSRAPQPGHKAAPGRHMHLQL